MLAHQFRAMWESYGGVERERWVIPALLPPRERKVRRVVKVRCKAKPKAKLKAVKPVVVVRLPRKPRERSPFTAEYRRIEREKASGPGWTAEEWIALRARYNNQCLACGSMVAIVPDHVIPMKRGGSHSIDNIQPLCNKCNIRKGLQFTDYRTTA